MKGLGLLRIFILGCLVLVPSWAIAKDRNEGCKTQTVEGIECSDVKLRTCHESIKSCGQIKMLIKMCQTKFENGGRCSDNQQYKFCAQHYPRCSEQKSAGLEAKAPVPKLRD